MKLEVSNNNGMRGAIDPRLTDTSTTQEERARLERHYADNPNISAPMLSGAQSCPAEWWRGMYALDEGCKVYAVAGAAGSDLVLGAVDEYGQLINGNVLRVIGLKKFKKCPDDFELFHSWKSYKDRVGDTY